MPTFREISDEMKKLRDPSIYVLYKVRTFVTQASPGTKQVMYKGTVQGEEMEYPVYAQFRQVEFSDEEKDGFVPYETKDREGNAITKYYRIPEIEHNNVALKCQCFTGDTLIPLTEGYSVSIKELVGKDHFYIYAFDMEKRKIVIGKGYNCEVKEKMAQLVEVTFDNGNKIKCTPDHKFFLKSGILKEAKDLLSSDSLQALYRQLGNRNKIKGYEQVLQEGKWEFTHDLADEFNLENKIYEKSAGTIRHHKDFNKFNNSPENVQRMKWYLHNKFHHERMTGENNPMKRDEVVEKVKKTNIANGNYEKSRERMINNNPMKNKDVVDKVIKTNRENGNYSFERMRAMSLQKTEEGLERIGQVQRKLIDEGRHIGLNKMIEVTRDKVSKGEHYFQTEEHSEKMSNINKQKVEKGEHLFQKIENRKNTSLRNSKLLSNLEEQEKRIRGRALKLVQKVIEKSGVFNRNTYQGMRGYPNFETIEKFGINELIRDATNHKVASIKFLNEREDVYCFTVEKYGNFFIDVDNGVSLSSGVLVKNCSDFRFFWEFPLYKIGSLIGSFRRYVRKTTTRPPKNPGNVTGFCKHIWSFVKALQGSNLVK